MRESGLERPPSEGSDVYTDLLRTMILIRRFEEAAYSLFLRGEVYGSMHLCHGQEAVSAGVAGLLTSRDRVAATYRGHGHVLALGTSPQRFMEELLGRRSGICGGRSGSMNVVDLEHGVVGCFGIVGGSLAAATGAALAQRGTGNIAVAFFGDGAVNQAYFYECLNFARVMRLPALYVCENNGYGEYTPMEAVTPGGILARPRALDIPSETVDGQDVWAVRAAAAQAIDRLRAGEGPAFLEARTYRYGDHGRGDPVKYRPDEEVAAWKARDPLEIARTRLIEEYGVPAADLEWLFEQVAAEITGTVERALKAPFPDADATGTEFSMASVR